MANNNKTLRNKSYAYDTNFTFHTTATSDTLSAYTCDVF